MMNNPQAATRRLTFYTSLVLAGLTLLVFVKVTGFQFLSYDDPDFVTNNPHVQNGFSWPEIVWAFKSLFTYWQPLVWMSYMFDSQLFGLSAKGYHFTNLLLHTANAVLLFLALKALTGAHWRSALVAALFAFHPLHVETVAWISDRKSLLSTTFWMLTMLSYASYGKKPGWGRYLLTLLAFALGLMSKSMLVTLPCVLLLFDYWPLRRLDLSGIRRIRKTAPYLVLEKIPFFALAAISSVLTVKAQQQTGTVWSFEHLPFGRRVTNALVEYVVYLRKMIWPTDLGVFYPLKGWAWEYVVFAVVVLLLISLVTLAFLKTKPYLAVGWLWYVGTLVPVIGLVQVGEQSSADRYTYVPLTGIFIMLVWAGGEFFAKRAGKTVNSTSPPPLTAYGLGPMVIALALVGACILGTARQLKYWRDSESLFEHTEAATGPNYLAEAALGDLLSQQGRLDEARKYFESALELQPKHPDILLAFGNLCFRQRNYKQAAESYQVVVQAMPRLLDARFNLAVSLHAQGQIEPAIAQYQKALEIQPSLVRAHLNLANLFMVQTNLTQALSHFKDAARWEPGNTEALNGLAWALVNHPDPKVRDGKEALGLANKTCEKTGFQHVGSLNVLAAAYAETGQFAEAVQTAQKAIDLAKAAGQGPLAEEILKLQVLYKQKKTCRGSDQLR